MDWVWSLPGSTQPGVDVTDSAMIKAIDAMSPATDGKIVNFSTGRIDPY
jgi:hypothetical protein